MNVYVNVVNRLARMRSDERGQATAEYGVVILIAIALGMAVLALFTTGSIDESLSGFIKKALSMATKMIN